GEFQRLGVVIAADLNKWMKFDGALAAGDRRFVVPVEEVKGDFRGWQQGPKRAGLFRFRQSADGPLERPCTAIQDRETHVGGCQRRLFTQDFPEFRLGFSKSPLEHMKSMRPMGAKFRRQAC